MAVFGLDWSAELPYYAERRALMWAGFMPQDPRSPEFTQAVADIRSSKDSKLDLAVFCGNYMHSSSGILSTLQVTGIVPPQTTLLPAAWMTTPYCSIYKKPGT